MSGGPKRNADRINTIGIVMIGICGAVLVYVSIAALQAFYANDVAEVQTMADYGGQDISAKDLKAAQIGNITNVGKTGKGLTGDQLYQIKIEDGMAAVLKTVNGDRQAGVTGDATNLVPEIGPQKTATIQPLYGRPKPLPTTTPPTPPPAPATDGASTGSGSAAATTPDANPGAANGATGLGTTTGTAPQSPTGTTTDAPLKADNAKGTPVNKVKSDKKSERSDKAEPQKGDKH